MAIYYIQKKEHMDSSGSLHTGFNCAIPKGLAERLGFDSKDRDARKVDVSYDEVNKQIVIKKITR